MPARRNSLATLLVSSTLALNACGLVPYAMQSPAPVASRSPTGPNSTAAGRPPAPLTDSEEKASDVVLFALGLIATDYRFGGKNPEAGLDCSGLVSYVFEKSIDLRLSGSAADLARQGKPVSTSELRPGDLVFFNTRNMPHSHVGIYIGDDRFIHAPNNRGKVRTESLKQGWFAARFEEGRTYIE